MLYKMILQPQSILITGGAGFVGSSLAMKFQAAGHHVTAMDNLMRKGSELNVPRLQEAGVAFVRGDVRYTGDWQQLPAFDLIIDCAAEPSVHAGATASPMPVIENNLYGTVQTLEKARRDHARFIFLSTSRVYAIQALRSIRLDEHKQRFEIAPEQELPGISTDGIAENFPVDTYRSFYGTTKLASEQLIQEYAAFYGLAAIINRCGVIAGPHQMGKVDQGVTALWVARHVYGHPLKYTGFAGRGQQVRDVLHPDDLFELLQRQLGVVESWNADIFNVGGGRDISFSLSELTAICREVTGRHVDINPAPETAPVDIPLYLTDITKAHTAFNWQPRKTVTDIVNEIHTWIRSNESVLRDIFIS